MSPLPMTTGVHGCRCSLFISVNQIVDQMLFVNCDIHTSREIYVFLAQTRPCNSSTLFLGQLFRYRVYVFQYRNPRDLGGYLGWF